MTHAYNEIYLDDAMNNLGEAFDYAVNRCNLSPDDFMNRFIAGGLADQFGSGVPKYISGMSGTELAMEVISRSDNEYQFPEIEIDYYRSGEYWCGWILAYYQWFTGHSFKRINNHVPISEILKLYPTLHEASEEKFVDTIDKIIKRNSVVTRLQMYRKGLGYSQKTLSEKSGVTLRMIQQYEQRAKDINKASGESLFALSRTLGCSIEDLMEF